MKRLAVVAILATFCAARADAAIIQLLPREQSPDGGLSLPQAGQFGETPAFGESLIYWSTRYSGTLDVAGSHSLAELFADVQRGHLITLTSPGLAPMGAGDDQMRAKVFERDLSSLMASSNVFTSLEPFEVSITQRGLRIQFEPLNAADAADVSNTLVNPEPSSIVLFGLGGSAMLLVARRRRKRPSPAAAG